MPFVARKSRRPSIGSDGFGAKVSSSFSSSFSGGFSGSSLFAVFIFLYMFIAFFYFHSIAIQSIKEFALETNLKNYLPYLSAYFLLLVGSSFLLGITSREITKPESDLEWLITLPISKSSLLWMKVIERTVLQPLIFLALVPGFSILLYKSQWNWFLAGITAFVISLPIAFFISLLQSLLEHLLRMSCKPSQLRNLQAVFHLLGVLGFYLSFPRSQSCPLGVKWLGVAVPNLLMILPQGLILRFLVFHETNLLLALVLELVFAGLAFHYGASFLLRNGVIGGGAIESATRGRQGETRSSWLDFFSPMIKKELTLLLRDTNYLSQTVLVPFLMLSIQLFLPRNMLGVNPERFYAAQAFAISTYAMITSVFMSVALEGQGLWLLLCFPSSLATLLRKKMVFWRLLSFFYWFLFLSLALLNLGGITLELLWTFALAFGGVYLFSWIALSLGILAVNEKSQKYKIQTSYLYVFLLLCAGFSITFFLNGFREISTSLLLFLFLGMALWQKAEERISRILDNSELAKIPVSAADGMILLFSFYQLQLAFLFMGKGFGVNSILFSSAAAGILVWAGSRLFFSNRNMAGFPTWLSKKMLRDFGIGLGLGVVCVLQAKVFYYFISVAGPSESESVPLSKGLVWAGLLVSPWFEEFLFRGVLLFGVSRYLDRISGAVGVSLLYALMHPTPIVIPMFLMGVLLSMGVFFTGSLFSAVIAHLVYNFYFLIYL